MNSFLLAIGAPYFSSRRARSCFLVTVVRSLSAMTEVVGERIKEGRVVKRMVHLVKTSIKAASESLFFLLTLSDVSAYDLV